MLPFRGNISRLALIVAMGVGSAASTAYAQTDNQGAIDEGDVVVVTGVRASLAKSLDIKRDARAIVDSINAEELGRFPDNNVADSLAHIPGITVSRDRGGEATFVNIRGLGPQFTTTTLNDRILATDDVGRNFAFDVLPAEIIAGADVWKTSEAKRTEGGIGGAINLRSARAFDNPGFNATVSAALDYNDLSEEVGAKFTGVVSNTFADERIGVLLGITHESGEERADEVFDNFHFGVGAGIERDVNENGTIEPNEQNLVVPGSYALGGYEVDFERTGITGSVEFKPNDRLSITADALYTRLDADTVGHTQSFFLVDSTDAQDRLSNITLDGNLVTGVDVADVTLEVVTRTEHRTVDTTLFGLNGEYEVNDNLSFAVDAYVSESDRPSGGLDSFVVAGVPGAHQGRYEVTPGGLPSFQIDLGGGRTANDFGNESFAPHWAALSGSDIEDKVEGISLEGDYEFENSILSSVEVGASFTSRTKSATAIDNINSGRACTYCGYPFPFAQVGADVVRPFPFDSLFPGVDGDVPRSFPVFDLDEYFAGLAAADGQTVTSVLGVESFIPEGTFEAFLPVFNPANSYEIDEDTTALYAQANFQGSDWFGNVGLRYVETDVLANFASNEIVSIDIVDPNVPNPEFVVERTSDTAGESEGGYDKLLPSLNFGKFFTDTLLLRVAAARTLSRPTLEQLAPLATDNAQSGLFTMNISGNPDIEPVFSDQLDVSLEWYFEDDSLLQVSVFAKDLDGFITSTTRTEQIAGEDFLITQPMNGDSADVIGIELAVQKFFDNGFGFTGSYAYTETDTVVGGEDAGPLPGVAEDSFSLSAIYEKDKISAQVSLDYTGELVEAFFSPLGDGFPTVRESDTQVSASLRYDIVEGGEIFIEGTNLLDDDIRTYQGRPDLLGLFGVYGRTFNVGARYTF